MKKTKLQESVLTKSEEKWCQEAEGRSDRSLLSTLAKMFEQPEKIREYHWIMYNEICFRGIENEKLPSTSSKTKTGSVSVAQEKKPAVKKDLGPGWVEGAYVRLTREYGGQSGVEGQITNIWNEDFPHDVEIRIKPYDERNPLRGLIFANKSELMLLNVPKDYKPKYYVPITKVTHVKPNDLRLSTDGKATKRKTNQIRA